QEAATPFFELAEVAGWTESRAVATARLRHHEGVVHGDVARPEERIERAQVDLAAIQEREEERHCACAFELGQLRQSGDQCLTAASERGTRIATPRLFCAQAQ